MTVCNERSTPQEQQQPLQQLPITKCPHERIRNMSPKRVFNRFSLVLFLFSHSCLPLSPALCPHSAVFLLSALPSRCRCCAHHESQAHQFVALFLFVLGVSTVNGADARDEEEHSNNNCRAFIWPLQKHGEKHSAADCTTTAKAGNRRAT